VAARVYRAIGVKLRRNGANPMNGRTVLSGAHRVAVAAVAMLRFFRPSIQGWTTYRGHDADLHQLLPGTLPGVHRPATSTTTAP
jgi:phytoene synthase